MINRSLIDAGIPVRCRRASFPRNFQDTVFVTPIGGAELTFTAASTGGRGARSADGRDAARRAGRALLRRRSRTMDRSTSPPAHPLRLVCRVVVNALVQFPATTREIPALATATARQVRAAINRQCRESGIGVVAEPRRLGVSVRRSADGVDGRSRGDRRVRPRRPRRRARCGRFAAGPARDALFDVVTTWGRDVLVRSATNRLYLRSANTGNVASDRRASPAVPASPSRRSASPPSARRPTSRAQPVGAASRR